MTAFDTSPSVRTPSPSISETPGGRKRRSPGKALARRIGSAGPTVVVAALFLLVVIVAALVPWAFTGGDPLKGNPIDSLLPPTFGHPFGTDQLGRDVFTRIVFGARDSLTVAFSATLISLVLATALGLIAGLGGRWADAIASRLIEVLFSFPSLLLALLVLTIFGTSVWVTTAAVGIALTPGLARLVRAEALVVKESGYVEAAKVLGHNPTRVVFRTITPNVLRPLLAFAFLNIGGALIWTMTLSYFGLGARPPAPEWGAMLADAQSFILQIWWLPLFTGLAVILTAVSATVVGRYLQQLLSGRNEHD